MPHCIPRVRSWGYRHPALTWSCLQWPPRDPGSGSAPLGWEAWTRVCLLAQWASMPAFLTFRKAGTAYLMDYLGRISKLRLDVLLPAYSWAFLCRKELSDCVSEKNRSDLDFLLIWIA